MPLLYFWYRLLRFKLHGRGKLWIPFALVLTGAVVFQNCAKVQFGTTKEDPNITVQNVCSGNQPADEFRDAACPQQPSTGKIVEKRSYSCDTVTHNWVPGSWTVVSNTCVPTGGPCPAGKVYSLGACRDMIVNYILTKGDDCSHPTATLKIDVIYSGSATPPALPRASGCPEYALNVPGPRHGEVHLCNSPTEDITLGDPGATHWTYTAATDTWSVTEVLRNSLFVPGTYYLNMKPADRSFVVRKGPIVLSNPNGDPDSCGPCPAGKIRVGNACVYPSTTTQPGATTTTTTVPSSSTTLAPTTTFGPTTSVASTTTVPPPTTTIAPSCLKPGYSSVNGSSKCAPTTAANGSAADMQGNPADVWDINRGMIPRYSNDLIQWHGVNYVIYYHLNGDRYSAMYDIDNESWINKFNGYMTCKCCDPWDYVKMWWHGDCGQDFFKDGPYTSCVMPVKNDAVCTFSGAPITCNPTRSTSPAGTYTNVGYVCTTTHATKTLAPWLTMCQFNGDYLMLDMGYFYGLADDPELCPPPPGNSQQ